MKKIIALLVVLTAVGALYAQPAGVSLGGNLYTGLRYTGGDNTDSVFDAAMDEFLYSGNHAQVNLGVNNGTWGADFTLGFNDIVKAIDGPFGNDATFSTDNVIQASGWANLLNDMLYVRIGRLHQFNYLTPIRMRNPDFGGVDKFFIEARPIDGLGIALWGPLYIGKDGSSDVVAITPEAFARNLEFALRYGNDSFSAFVVYDGSQDSAGPDKTVDAYHQDFYFNFGLNAVENLIFMLEGKFFNLGAEDKFYADFTTQIGYQISDALSARITLFLGSWDELFQDTFANGLLSKDDDSFSLHARPRVDYKISDSLAARCELDFQIPDTDAAGNFNIWFRPKLYWDVAPGAQIVLAYKLTILNVAGFEYDTGKSPKSGTNAQTARSIANVVNVGFAFNF